MQKVVERSNLIVQGLGSCWGGLLCGWVDLRVPVLGKAKKTQDPQGTTDEYDVGGGGRAGKGHPVRPVWRCCFLLTPLGIWFLSLRDIIESQPCTRLSKFQDGQIFTVINHSFCLICLSLTSQFSMSPDSGTWLPPPLLSRFPIEVAVAMVTMPL